VVYRDVLGIGIEGLPLRIATGQACSRHGLWLLNIRYALSACERASNWFCGVNP
jgi:hypothetical protein